MLSFDTAFDRLIGHEEILEALNAAMLAQTRAVENLFVPPSNSRNYKCKIATCVRPAYARNLCNAHYLRRKNGYSMDRPVKARKRDDLCTLCGTLTGAKGGWGLCVRHYKKKRAAVIKDALIDLFGGVCWRCKNKFPRAVFDFHHVSDKSGAVGNLISGFSVARIAEEISKCILLCANCHRLEHNDGF